MCVLICRGEDLAVDLYLVRRILPVSIRFIVDSELRKVRGLFGIVKKNSTISQREEIIKFIDVSFSPVSFWLLKTSLKKRLSPSSFPLYFVILFSASCQTPAVCFLPSGREKILRLCAK
jgi:hypothetical protein